MVQMPNPRCNTLVTEISTKGNEGNLTDTNQKRHYEDSARLRAGVPFQENAFE
jgi:hypothetical protein